MLFIQFSRSVYYEAYYNQNTLKTFILILDTCHGSPFTDCTSWTGGNDISVEGDYRWQSSDSKMNFTNWARKEPSVIHKGREEDCVELMKNGQWNDRDCYYLNPFICEKGM
jgi:hypothetical protein